MPLRQLVLSSHARFAQSCSRYNATARALNSLGFQHFDWEHEYEHDEESHSHYLVPTIDVEDLAGYCRGSIAGEEDSGGA